MQVHQFYIAYILHDFGQFYTGTLFLLHNDVNICVILLRYFNVFKWQPSVIHTNPRL